MTATALEPRAEDWPAPGFESAGDSVFLDYFRIPVRAAGREDAGVPERHPLASAGWARWHGADGTTRYLRWPSGSAQAEPGLYRLGDIPVAGPVLPDSAARGWLTGTGERWAPTEAVLDGSGARVASIWRSEGGSAFVPFDLDEVITGYWSERYLAATRSSAGSAATTAARRLYYRLRPLVPRALQLRLRRAYSRLQRRSEFPRWPAEPALHDLYDRLLALLAGVAREPVPWIAPWPGGYDFALVLTHDVETAEGQAGVRELRDVELEHGLRSSWNFVPERYEVDEPLMEELAAGGFEVGVHGLKHDGLDFDSPERFAERLPAVQDYARRWGAVGFRAPALHRRWEWMSSLGVEYDSSYPDTDPYEPQAGGCCTWLPFMNGDLVELPVTLAQDHTLLAILRRNAGDAWIGKASYLAERGGMALIIVHPDYVSGKPERAEYERFLAAFASRPGTWNALPREVARWWRRRSESRLELAGGRWTVVGPAAGEAAIRFAEPEGAA